MTPSPESRVPSPESRLDRILIVRLGSLGDVVHGLPVLAALRTTYPAARIDWLVDRRHVDLLRLAPGIDRLVVLERPTISGWLAAIRELRQARYDVAIDLQGLVKSAVLARASGARRVLGFASGHLREPAARPLYSETVDPRGVTHVIRKNLALAARLGVTAGPPRFPLESGPSPVLEEVRGWGERWNSGFALVNPGGAWPNKCWPPDRFGAIATVLRDRFGLASLVLWGPGEEQLAQAVARASDGAARVAPPTRIADLVALSREAALMVSGDTGPLHIAAAGGTPIVSLFGPTDPSRNGPWSEADVTVSRYDRCTCHYRRRCRQHEWCLADIAVDEVAGALTRRLADRVANP